MITTNRRLALQSLHWLATEIDLRRPRIELIRSLLVNKEDPSIVTVGLAEDPRNLNDQ